MPRKSKKSALQDIIDSKQCPGFTNHRWKPFVDTFTFEKPVEINSEQQFKDECAKRGISAMHKADLRAIGRQG